MPAGRPKGTIKAIDDSHIPLIEKMAGVGMSAETIADYFGMSRRTFLRRAKGKKIAAALARGRAVAQISLAQMMFDVAMDPKNPPGARVQAGKYVLSCQYGWREKTDIELGFKPRIVFETIVAPDGSLVQEILDEEKAKARALPAEATPIPMEGEECSPSS